MVSLRNLPRRWCQAGKERPQPRLGERTEGHQMVSLRNLLSLSCVSRGKSDTLLGFTPDA